MSWGPRRRRLLQRWMLRAGVLALLLGVTATLAAALQVREVRVEGTQRFPAEAIRQVLHSALGSPTLTVRPDDLREAVLRLPWVAEAQVRLSLDGVVACTVEERVPVAVATSRSGLELVDREGRLLFRVTSAPELPVLEGFAPYPEERAALLAAIDALGARWGTPVRRALRLGPNDVRLDFGQAQPAVVVDPAKPDNLVDARKVLAAWTITYGGPPAVLDARVARRIAVVPAPVQPLSEEAS